MSGGSLEYVYSQLKQMFCRHPKITNKKLGSVRHIRGKYIGWRYYNFNTEWPVCDSCEEIQCIHSHWELKHYNCLNYNDRKYKNYFKKCKGRPDQPEFVYLAFKCSDCGILREG